MVFVSKLGYYRFLLIMLSGILLSGCSQDKFVPDNEYLLDKIELKSDVKKFDASQLSRYVRQKGNSKWFSMFKIPLNTYSLAGRDSTKWINRTLQKMGEKPVLYDSVQARLSCEDLQRAMQNMGYMNATVEVNKQVSGKKMKIIYNLHPGEPYIINNFHYDIQDSLVEKVLASHLNAGEKYKEHPMQFTVSSLDEERKRLTKILQDSGYYHFHKDYIYYTADSTNGPKNVDITLHLMKSVDNSTKEVSNHPRYIINNINIISEDSSKLRLRRSVIDDNIAFEKGKYFSATDLQKTYNNFARLGAVRYTAINFHERPVIDSLVIGRQFSYKTSTNHYLDADVEILYNKTNTISFQPEGTNTAGNLGAAGTLSYQNRNLFRGSENLSIELRAAFEAITGLEGYKDKDYVEYSVRGRLQFPRLLAPFVSKEVRRRSSATSELAVSWDLQNRPEFHRRVFSAGWKYAWSNPIKHLSYSYNLLDLSYVYMPWISSTFKHDYIDNTSNRNAILKYNYEDLFIMSMGFGVSYKTPTESFHARIESAGNILNAVSKPFHFKKNEDGQKKFIKIAYAQYMKFDMDYTHIFQFDKNNSLALHTDFGIAYPYGNSTVLPFEKRYFAGGANSVRGWSVRELGPGKFKGQDGRIDFINQTGDMKLDINAEYRTHLFWKFDGAVFIDAGNVWTLRKYDEQPGGQFKFKNFFKELAVAYGLGLRLNFDYFILRFDGGMKAINPAYSSVAEHYALLHPDFHRDFTFHFAVGLPF